MSVYTVTTHSFMRGTGKSTLTAALGRLLGRVARVAVIDGDLTTPSLARLLQVSPRAGCTLNDVLTGSCPAVDAAQLVPPASTGGEGRADPAAPTGCLYLVPASDQADRLSQVVRAEMPFDEVARCVQELSLALDLDVVILEAAAGLSGLSLPLLALADELAVVLRLDQQDYQGSSVTLDVARRLGVVHSRLIVNRVPEDYDLQQLERTVADTYGAPVTALPFSAPDEVGNAPALGQIGRALLSRAWRAPEDGA